MKKIGFNFNKKNFKIDLESCNFFKRFKGLMFCRREKANALLFEFNKPNRIKLHSLFVFFPFLVLWLDNKNKVIDLTLVKPFKFSISAKRNFSKIIEIPINKKYEDIIKFLVGN